MATSKNSKNTKGTNKDTKNNSKDKFIYSESDGIEIRMPKKKK